MILNLTENRATPEQKAMGVVDLPDKFRSELMEATTFNELPSPEKIRHTAYWVKHIIQDSGIKAKCVMIEGAPWFIGALERELSSSNYEVVYSFTERVSLGEVKHVGFVKSTLTKINGE